jgi:hypothetical protein
MPSEPAVQTNCAVSSAPRHAGRVFAIPVFDAPGQGFQDEEGSHRPDAAECAQLGGAPQVARSPKVGGNSSGRLEPALANGPA